MSPKPNAQYEGIQALRFVAALLVVLTHATFYVSERLIDGYPVWTAGASGVDVFFVISGFVMVVSSQSLMGRPDGASQFLLRRLSRIVPLYWVATSVKLAAVLAVPVAVLNAGLDPVHIVASYLFLPWWDGSGKLQPVLGVGWTLNFEMFFYAMFALAMALRVSPVKFVGVLFTALSVLAFFRQPDWPPFAFWLDTIVLEFVAGMVIAQLALRGVTMPPLAAAALLVAGFVLMFQDWGDGLPVQARALVWGLPATAIVAAVVSLEPLLRSRVPKSAMRLGDASYALYLFHPLVAPIAPAVLAKAVLPIAWLSIGLSIAISVAVSLAVYLWFERPTTDFLKGLTGGRRRVRAA
jgi:peptidoglycan/LPS O-acetylase OafA/YrhL